MDCKHKLICNTEKGFVFCEKCGERWEGKGVSFFPVYIERPRYTHHWEIAPGTYRLDKEYPVYNGDDLSTTNTTC